MDPQLVEDPPVAPQAHARTSRPDHDAVAAAIERRLQDEREKVAAATAASSNATFDGNHEKRQEFRRMIDPGILRPNPRHVALESLQVHPLYVLSADFEGVTVCLLLCADAVEACGEHHRTSGGP